MSVTEVSEDPGVALEPYLPRLVVEWANPWYCGSDLCGRLRSTTQGPG